MALRETLRRRTSSQTKSIEATDEHGQPYAIDANTKSKVVGRRGGSDFISAASMDFRAKSLNTVSSIQLIYAVSLRSTSYTLEQNECV